MPLTYFNCAVGQIPISECLNHCPNPDGRCLSLPTLTTIGQSRTWKGIPSTTQCLNPTRMEYLQIKYDFAVDPFDQAFALLGTRHHYTLESVAKKIEGLKSELLLKGEVSGILDLLEPINGSDNYCLIDYKCFGSFAVAQQLGISKDDNSSEYARFKLALQVNNYRIMAQELGFNITELKVQFTVRDGGTFIAKKRGIDKNIYLLPVELLDDTLVKEYFLTKAFNLCHAIETDTLPELCDYQERWEGRRCKGYCGVYSYCPEGAKVNKVEYKG